MDLFTVTTGEGYAYGSGPLAATFKLAGTVDGFVNFATPRGTYTMPVRDAAKLAKGFLDVIADVYDKYEFEEGDAK